MKKITYILLLFVFISSGIMMNSCDDTLDTKNESALDEVLIFSKYELAYGAITSIYKVFGEQNYRARFLPWYGFNTDIEWYNSSQNSGAEPDIAVYRCSKDNTQLNNSGGLDVWTYMYAGIERSNLAITGLRQYGNPDNDPKMAQLLGEALTLRAIFYTDLINCWGDVVARFEPVNSETMYAAVSDKDIIYKQIIADLQEAQNLVAWPNETTITSTVEHINKAFVKGLLARVCLQASGYSLRRESAKSELSTDPELAKSVLYPIALQACKEVIASGTCKLESSFENIFIKNCKDDITAGGESLWEIPYANEPTARGRQVYTFGTRHAMQNGSASDQFGLAQGGKVGPTPNFFYDYSIKDKRRDVTCIPYEWSDNAISVQQLRKLNTWTFGKYRYEWMDRYITTTDDGINKQYMRYADIILMAAEAENELNGPAGAVTYMKLIRQRAFDQADWATEVDNYLSQVSTSKQNMFEAIVNERAFEFCGELLRKADLIRWNRLKSNMDEAKAKMYRLRQRTGEYANLNEKVYYNMVDFSWTRSGKVTVEPAAAIQFYGLNYGETEDKTGQYESSAVWISPSNLEDTKIESIYARDPDLYMYWPIFDVTTSVSNGFITNPSWYQ